MKLDESLFEEIDEKGMLFNHRYNVIDVTHIDNDVYTLYQDTDYPLYFIMKNYLPYADWIDDEIEDGSFNHKVFEDEEEAIEYFENIKEGTIMEDEKPKEDDAYALTDLQLKDGLTSIFSDLVTKEYALVEDYTGALLSLENYEEQGAEIDNSLIEMLNTLIDIENNNLGALQYTVSYLGGSTEQIKQGMDKAEADLNGSAVDGITAEEDEIEDEVEIDDEIEDEIGDEEITESLNEADEEEDTEDKEADDTEEESEEESEEDETSDIVTFDAINVTAGDEGQKPQSTDIEIDTIKYIVSLGKSLCSIETDDATYQVKQGIDKVQMQIEDVSDVIFIKTKVVDITNEDEEDIPELLVSININNIDSIDMLDDGSYIELKSGAKFEADIDYADLVDIMEDAGFEAETDEEEIDEKPEEVTDEEEDLDNQEDEEDYDDEEDELEETFSRQHMRSNGLRRMW